MSQQRFFCLAVTCIALLGPLSAPATAQEHAVAPTPTPAPTQDEAIDGFVNTAIQQGLLRPVGSGSPPQQDSSSPPVATIAPNGCESVAVLDFSALSSLETYPQLVSLENTIGQAEHETAILSPAAERAQAYLALVLTSEVRSILSGTDGREVDLLLSLSGLIDGQASTALLSEVAACSPSASFWSTLSALIEEPGANREAFTAQVPAMRPLPKQLRLAVADLALDALAQTDDLALRRRILAMFTQADLENVTRLRFHAAVLALASNQPDAEAAVRSFASRQEYRTRAIAALVRHDYPIERLPGGVMGTDLSHAAQQISSPEELAQLDALLEQLDHDARYSELLSLIESDPSEGTQRHDVVHERLAAMVRDDLADGGGLEVLSAVEFMLDNTTLLASSQHGRSLFELAALRAFEMGLPSLGKRLAPQRVTTEDVAVHLAEYAFDQQHFSEVFDLATQFTENVRLNDLAARGALAQGDDFLLDIFLERLPLSDEAVLDLVNEDIRAGSTALPQAVYAQLDQIDGPRARSLRSLAGAPVTSARQVTGAAVLGDAPRILANTALVAGPRGRE